MAWVDFIPQYLSESGRSMQAVGSNYWENATYGSLNSGSLAPPYSIVVYGPCEPMIISVNAGETFSGFYPWDDFDATNHTLLFYGRLYDGIANMFMGAPSSDIPAGTLFRLRTQRLEQGSPPAFPHMGFALSDLHNNSMVDVRNSVDLPYYTEEWSEWVEVAAEDLGDYEYAGFGWPRQACVRGAGRIAVEWQVWVPDPPPPGYKVYELDKGWSFDGAYIPHFLELNWYFGDDPIHYHSLHKIRIHGLSKGYTNLSVATNGMDTDYERDYSEGQVIDLPRNMKHISTELLPETNTVTSANRGLSIQMKFEGRNTDLARPEPQHVIQVLALQSSPAGTGRRSE